MIRDFLFNPALLAHLIVWMVVGSVNSFAVIPLVLLSNVLWFRNEQYLEIVCGFLFMTLLSDSRNTSLAFSQTVKAIQVVLLFGLYFLNFGFYFQRARVFAFLIPYLLIGVVCLYQSPILFESFQKTLSYLLVLLVIPNLLFLAFEKDAQSAVKNFIYFLSIILIVGILARFLPVPFIIPSLEGRFTGMFGNPNGLAIYSFLFIMAFNLINERFKELFSKREIIFIYSLAAFSLITSGSRGALLATLVFLAFRFYGYRFGFIAFSIVVTLVVSFEFAVDLLADLAVSAGLGDFFRVDTLESGSGRLIAINFAWENIQKNYWLGLGIGYGDYLFKENYIYLANLGHQGQVHNAYLNVWLDTGLIGLTAFVFGWGRVFFNLIKRNKYFWGVAAGVFVSTNAEVWIVGSLSPWMVTFLGLITIFWYFDKENVDLHNSQDSLAADDVKKEFTVTHSTS